MGCTVKAVGGFVILKEVTDEVWGKDPMFIRKDKVNLRFEVLSRGQSVEGLSIGDIVWLHSKPIQLTDDEFVIHYADIVAKE